MTDLVTTERFSHIVGLVYDCAIEPARWPSTMEVICGDLCFTASTLMTAHFHSRALHFIADYNASPHYQALIASRFGEQAISMFRSYASAQADIDEPLVISRGPMGLAGYRLSPMYLEWARPQGYGDSLNAVVLREQERIGALALIRREADGIVSDGQVSAMRLLTPHIRRSVTISHLMDLKTFSAAGTEAALDAFRTGIVLVAADGRVLHANRAAADMLALGRPIHVKGGRLRTSDGGGSTAELALAIRQAAEDETRIGRATIGLRIGTDEEPASLLHVLPLAHGELRTSLMPAAAAAVFIARATAPPADIAQALANGYGLTPAEQRVLHLLLERVGVADAAARLEISPNTVKTHIARIFEKTGVASQADLVRLGSDLVPPIRLSS